jgi:chromosome segregation protein
MRLARISISGFKSFADRTDLRFDAPIIGIVGPNGCGKSNVVDAVKWVLGERSAKSLRGDAMLDVIFAGSAARKPMGAASVTLTFENPVVRPEATEPAQRRFLGIDAEEVDVGRRLYRDGRSEYLINGRKCRLRDVKELFMDTGIGTNAYSIIEQGRVDAMLTTDPVQRRQIFEEAAGIAKFKARRIEAERKLERSEINLVQVREQLASTERRLRIVRGQAAKARRFRELDERHRRLRTDLALDVYHELRERLDGLTSRIADLESQRSRLTEVLTQLEDEKQTAELNRHDLQLAQRELEQRRLELVGTRRHAEQRREMVLRNLGDTRQHVDEDAARIEELDGRLAVLGDQIEETGGAIENARAEVDEVERLVSTLSRERATRQESLVAARERADRVRSAIDRDEQRKAQATVRVESITGRFKGLREQADRLAQRRRDLEREATACEAAIETAEAERVDAQERVDGIETRLAEDHRAAATLGQRQADLSRRLADDRHEQAALRSRLHLLEEMHQAREGLGDAVKTVLDRAAEYPGIRGLLADAVDTDRKHAPIVEAALGADLHLVLVDCREDLKSLEPVLRELPGRVGLLPLDGDASTPATAADPEGEPEAGWVTPLNSLIRVEPHAERVVRRLLERTVLVWDLDSALALAAGPMAGWRFVTRRGEVVDPQGRVIVGAGQASARGAGWLSRRIGRSSTSSCPNRHRSSSRSTPGARCCTTPGTRSWRRSTRDSGSPTTSSGSGASRRRARASTVSSRSISTVSSRSGGSSASSCRCS